MNRIFASLFALSLVGGVAAAQNTKPLAASETAKPATNNPEVAQFQKIEDTWSNAVNQHDQYSLELVLSPIFIDVSANGEITTRNQQLAQVITEDDKSRSLTQHVVTVRTLGDIAVANGTYTLHHKVGSAQVDERGIFTHVFERQRGGWICVNSQRTALRNEPTGKQKKQQLTNDSPFHIPLFGK
jgi:hypothetical protein